jgi:hypothetical protein
VVRHENWFYQVERQALAVAALRWVSLFVRAERATLVLGPNAFLTCIDAFNQNHVERRFW